MTSADIIQSKEFFGELDTNRSGAAEVVAFYNKYATQYNECLSDSGYTDTTDYCSLLLKQELGESFANKEILDVGCGSGKSGISLQKQGFLTIDGVDPADKMLVVARELGCYRNVSEGCVTETQPQFPYDAGVYDGILCAGCFTVGHMEIKQGIPEFLRLLKKGGVAVYTISFTLDKGVVMAEHAPFVTSKQLQVQRIERRFYHFIGKDSVYCEVYCVKKL